MHLQQLSLINFKNYKELEVSFSKKINGFIGKNGVGKTNLFDSIYYLSLCKSYFNPVDSQNIKHDEAFFLIQGLFERKTMEEKVYCGLKKGQKKVFKRNNKDYKKLSEHIGLIPLVMVSPSDASLILEGSEQRRKYMNGVISQYDKEYLDHLIAYNKVLNQRNSLLKHFRGEGVFDEETLSVYDQQLISYAYPLYQKRLDFTERLIPVFQDYYNRISEQKEEVSLEYKSHLELDDFEELLMQNREKDRILQYTSVGIHKDDLLLKLRSYPIKKIGSQGQQKTYLVALKLAQHDFIKEVHGISPILLLDDVFDKLDQDRVFQIIKLVSGNNFGQIFISDTGKERLETILKSVDADSKLFTITETRIIQEL